MSFPPTFEILRHFNMFMVLPPLALLASSFIWLKIYLTWRRRKGGGRAGGGDRIKKKLLWAVMTLVIGGMGMLIYRQVFTAFRFRFDPDDVAEIRISHRNLGGGEPSEVPALKSIVIRDPAFIREGLLKLGKARGFRASQPFEGIAYRIDLRFKDSSSYSDRWLELCDRTKLRGDINAVMPHIGSGHDVGNEGGEYVCPDFHDWFTERVIPLLQESDTPSTEVPSSHDLPDLENS